MATPFNHKAIEKKWRENWEKNPINVNDGKKPKYSRIHPATAFMSVTGEAMLFLTYGAVTNCFRDITSSIRWAGMLSVFRQKTMR